jgi:3-dehydroquinate synthase
MKKIELKLTYKKIENCDIIFDANIFLKKNIKNILKPITKNNPVFVFVDKNLYKKMNLRLYCKTLESVLKAEIYLLKGGEQVKSFSYFKKYIEKIFRKGVTSNSFVIAIGGGTIIDLAGYISSIIFRGINFISIPTTLLASADAAISCKNALNLGGGKNQIGTYQLPKKVFIETTYIYDFLDTRHFWDGYAEIIKHGIGHSKRLLDYLKKNKSKYLNKKNIKNLSKEEKQEFKNDITRVLKLAIRSKVVLFNKNNNELQPVYHFGHTIGHALEIATRYKCFHGEAITIGMLVAIELSIKRYNLSKRVLTDTKKIFLKYNLPIKLNKIFFDIKLFDRAIKKDKRYFGKRNNFILMNRLFKISEKLIPIDKKDYLVILNKYIK